MKTQTNIGSKYWLSAFLTTNNKKKSAITSKQSMKHFIHYFDFVVHKPMQNTVVHSENVCVLFSVPRRHLFVRSIFKTSFFFRVHVWGR